MSAALPPRCKCRPCGDWRPRSPPAHTLNVAFAPFGWWPIAVLAPAALFALIRGLPPRRAGWTGAAFGAGLFAFGTYWLYTCLHVFGLVPIWLTVALQAALIGLMSLYSAALCYVANRFWLKPGATRAWLVLPVLWVLLEWLRGWALSGFPWLSLGYAMIDSPLKGWAPLFGIYGVNLGRSHDRGGAQRTADAGRPASAPAHGARRHRDPIADSVAARALRLDARRRAARLDCRRAGCRVAGPKSGKRRTSTRP